MQIAKAQGCKFSHDFKDRTFDVMLKPTDSNSIMFQDFAAKRPMEVETYLGSSVKLGQTEGIRIPRIETVYALLHHINILNQSRPPPPPPASNGPMPPTRGSSGSYTRPPMNGVTNGMPNGAMRGGRASSMGAPRRGGPMNGYPARGSTGYNMRAPGQLSRRTSFDGNDLGEEFSHVVLYDGAIPEGDAAVYDNDSSPSGINLRERELMLRQRELQIREQEFNMRRGNRRPPPSKRGDVTLDEDEDDDDFFDPMASRAPSMAPIDADNFDMMSVTSRRNRKAPSQSQIRRNPENAGRGGGYGGGYRPGMNRNRASARLMQDVPGLHDSLMENPLMAYASNRYGTVDRKVMSEESRAGSLTRERLAELQGAGNNVGMNGAYPTPPRRTSLSPGDPFNQGRRTSGRPSPPGADGYMAPHGMPMNGGMNGGINGGMHAGMNGGMNGAPNGRPSPPGVRQPIPRHPPGQGNAVAPQQVEQRAGVSNSFPLKRLQAPQVRSLTGSASASAESGDSGASPPIDSEASAHSSQSSLAARRLPALPPMSAR